MIEKNKRVYIGGVSNRGDEVLLKLSVRGGINAGSLHGSDCRMIYFIDHNNVIAFTQKGSELYKFIVDLYQELTLPPEKWKEGTIVTDNAAECFCIVSKEKDDGKWFRPLLYIDQNDYSTKSLVSKSAYHPADDNEKEKFHDLLHGFGLEWDARSGQIVSYRWKPQEGDTYYYIDSDGSVIREIWHNNPGDRSLSFGNCFPNRKLAEEMGGKIREMLSNKDIIAKINNDAL
jgi:hypothetical protein